MRGTDTTPAVIAIRRINPRNTTVVFFFIRPGICSPKFRAGGPDSENWCLWASGSWREYHCGTSRESIETRRVPQVRFLNLGLGVDVLCVEFAMPTELRR